MDVVRGPPGPKPDDGPVTSDSVRVDGVFRLAVPVVAGLVLVAPLVQTLKLFDAAPQLGFGLSLVKAFGYVRLLILPLLFTGSFLLLLIRNEVRLDALGLTLVMMVLWGATFTLVYGGHPVDIGGNVLRVAFALACYHAARRYAGEDVMRRGLLWIGVGGAAGTTLAVLLVYGLGVAGGRSVYLGLSTQGLFVPLAYFLARERTSDWVWVVLILALVVAGGKRGNMLAALTMILVATLFLRRFSMGKTLALGGLVSAGVLMVLSLNLPALVEMLPPALGSRFVPFLSDGTGGFDVAAATSNRNAEIMSVLQIWQEAPVNMYSGLGWGANIQQHTGSLASTVHVSPVALAFQYGVILGGFVFMLIVALPIRAILRLRDRMDVVDRTWWLAGIGALTLSLSVMTILQDPVLWLSLGYLSFLLRDRAAPQLSAAGR